MHLFRQLKKAALAGLLLASTGMAVAPPQDAMPVDRFVALVNSRVVTAGEVFALFQPVEAQLRVAYEGEALLKKLEEAYDNALQALIDKALILEEFAAQGGNLSDRAVDDYINNIIHERFNSDRAAFFDALAQERMTISDWKAEMKDRLIVSLMRRREVGDRVVITPGEVRTVYEARLEKYSVPEQLKLRMIMVHQGSSEEDRAAKQTQAEKIRTRIVEGEEFAAVAKEVSEGPKAAQGGDLGWLEPSSLREELTKAIRSLPPLQVSEVIPAGNEFYILLVEARKNAQVRPFEEVRTEIEEELFQAESNRLYDAWIARLRKKFNVKLFETDS